jgi:hypothetical protein
MFKRNKAGGAVFHGKGFTCVGRRIVRRREDKLNPELTVTGWPFRFEVQAHLFRHKTDFGFHRAMGAKSFLSGVLGPSFPLFLSPEAHQLPGLGWERRSLAVIMLEAANQEGMSCPEARIRAGQGPGAQPCSALCSPPWPRFN